MKKKFGSEVYEYSKDRYKLLIVAPIITAIGSIIFMIITVIVVMMKWL